MAERYRLYIDESGDHSFGLADGGEADDPARRYLGLVGVVVETETYRTRVQPDLELLKQNHFPHSPDEPVVLHRKGILNATGAFWRLRDGDERAAFNQDLLQYLRNTVAPPITRIISAYRPYWIAIAACSVIWGHAVTLWLKREVRRKTEDSKRPIGLLMKEVRPSPAPSSFRPS